MECPTAATAITAAAATIAALADKEASMEAAAMGLGSRSAMVREVPIMAADLATAMGSRTVATIRAMLATGERDRIGYFLLTN